MTIEGAWTASPPAAEPYGPAPDQAAPYATFDAFAAPGPQDPATAQALQAPAPVTLPELRDAFGRAMNAELDPGSFLGSLANHSVTGLVRQAVSEASETFRKVTNDPAALFAPVEALRPDGDIARGWEGTKRLGEILRSDDKWGAYKQALSESPQWTGLRDGLKSWSDDLTDRERGAATGRIIGTAVNEMLFGAAMKARFPQDVTPLKAVAPDTPPAAAKPYTGGLTIDVDAVPGRTVARGPSAVSGLPTAPLGDAASAVTRHLGDRDIISALGDIVTIDALRAPADLAGQMVMMAKARRTPDVLENSAVYDRAKHSEYRESIGTITQSDLAEDLSRTSNAEMARMPLEKRSAIMEHLQNSKLGKEYMVTMGRLMDTMPFDKAYSAVENERQIKLIDSIEADPELMKAKRDWAVLDDHEKLALLTTVNPMLEEIYGIKDVSLSVFSEGLDDKRGYLAAKHNISSADTEYGFKSTVSINVHPDVFEKWSFGDLMGLYLHEACAHVSQTTMFRDVDRGVLDLNHPEGIQALMYKANKMNHVFGSRGGRELYENQLIERHAFGLQQRVRDELDAE